MAALLCVSIGSELLSVGLVVVQHRCHCGNFPQCQASCSECCCIAVGVCPTRVAVCCFINVLAVVPIWLFNPNCWYFSDILCQVLFLN